MEEDYRLRAACRLHLSQHRGATPSAELAALAAHPAAQLSADVYGDGGAVRELEQRSTALLGKPAARFFMKGMIAQMSVLRALADQRGSRAIALHPLSHIDFDEEGAAWCLHGLEPVRLGAGAPFGVAELERVTQPLAAVVVELPLRRAGYLLPPIHELRAISRWCQKRGVHLHIDGARIWEAAAGYGVDLPELATLADSLYVSFYKGLGGLAGAAVVGEVPLIDALAIWKTRHGANLYSGFPYAISALAGIERHLPRMSEYVQRARALAEALKSVGSISVLPSLPHVNAFHLLLPGTVETLTARNRAIARAHGIWLFNTFYASPVNGRCVGEVVIGDNSDDYSPVDAAGWITRFLDGA